MYGAVGRPEIAQRGENASDSHWITVDIHEEDRHGGINVNREKRKKHIARKVKLSFCCKAMSHGESILRPEVFAFLRVSFT